MSISNPTITTITTPTGPGNIIVSDGSGLASWNSVVELNSDMIEFFELVLSAIGYDITYDQFTKMSKEQRKSILRDIKLKRVLDVNN